jgi:hypothetical protein
MAFCFRFVEAQRVGGESRMDKAVLRRDRNKCARPRKEDWLSQLQIPVAEGHAYALVSRNRKLVRQDIRVKHVCVCSLSYTMCSPVIEAGALVDRLVALEKAKMPVKPKSRYLKAKNDVIE